MKQFASFSDTVTIDESNEKEINDGMPRNVAVMMILNEVADSSMNGGGAKEKTFARKSKPQFILISDSRQNCKKVMCAFSEIFTTKVESTNKKNKYEVTLLQQDETSGLLKESVDKFIEQGLKRRVSVSTKPVTLEAVQNKLSENVGGIMD